MARDPKTGKFQKGYKGGPGRPKKPDDVKAAAKLTRTNLEKKLNHFLAMDSDELSAILKDPKTPMLEVMVGRIVLMAAKNGDQTRLDFLLNRLLGKVKDNVEVSVVKPTFIRRYDGSEVIELGAEEVKELGDGE